QTLLLLTVPGGELRRRGLEAIEPRETLGPDVVVRPPVDGILERGVEGDEVEPLLTEPPEALVHVVGRERVRVQEEDVGAVAPDPLPRDPLIVRRRPRDVFDERLADRGGTARVPGPERTGVRTGQDPAERHDRDRRYRRPHLLKRGPRGTVPLRGPAAMQVRVPEPDHRVARHLTEEGVAAPGRRDPDRRIDPVQVHMVLRVVPEHVPGIEPEPERRRPPLDTGAVDETRRPRAVPGQRGEEPRRRTRPAHARRERTDPRQVVERDREAAGERRAGRRRPRHARPIRQRLGRRLLHTPVARPEEQEQKEKGCAAGTSHDPKPPPHRPVRTHRLRGAYPRTGGGVLTASRTKCSPSARGVAY